MTNQKTSTLEERAMDVSVRACIRSLAQDGIEQPDRERDIWQDAETVLAWLDSAEPADPEVRRSTTERVEALLEKQLAYMEDPQQQRGPLPFVPSGDTTALRDLVATLRDLHAMSLEVAR